MAFLSIPRRSLYIVTHRLTAAHVRTLVHSPRVYADAVPNATTKEWKPPEIKEITKTMGRDNKISEAQKDTEGIENLYAAIGKKALKGKDSTEDIVNHIRRMQIEDDAI